MHHDELLDFAKKTLSGIPVSAAFPRKEILYRAIASRAYYFIYHHVKKRFHQSSKSYIAHVDLISLLQNSTNFDEKRSVSYVKNCKNLRVKADYRLDIVFEKSDAEQAIIFADRVKQILP